MCPLSILSADALVLALTALIVWYKLELFVLLNKTSCVNFISTQNKAKQTHTGFDKGKEKNEINREINNGF